VRDQAFQRTQSGLETIASFRRNCRRTRTFPSSAIP
jgi:hypothetical protein